MACSQALSLNFSLILQHASLCVQVRWAACQALGQMCTDLGPDIQEKCGVRILPALIALMDDFNNPRVQVGVAFCY